MKLRQKAIGVNKDSCSGLLVTSGRYSRKKKGSNNGNGARSSTNNSMDGANNTRYKTCYYYKEQDNLSQLF